MAGTTLKLCTVCGEPLPEGEQMFRFHGYSGPCPKPPLKPDAPDDAWARISKDPELDRARQKLSMHELRRIIKHVVDAKAEGQ